MIPSTRTVILAGAALVSLADAQIDPNLVGTWTSKSQKVYTGPGFYNPVSDRLIEPALPGISYSFTSDGWYEEAYYRAISNPTTPTCPSGVMQWQHGNFIQNANGSLTLNPISVDGRQIVSDKCNYDQSIYTRYKQPEYFRSYEVSTDPYHGVKRLDLYEFDGTPQIPLYLAYYPTPQMLPTQTLNPTSSATKGAAATSTSATKRKRTVPDLFSNPQTSRILDPDLWWWFGVSMTGVGAIAYYAF